MTNSSALDQTLIVIDLAAAVNSGQVSQGSLLIQEREHGHSNKPD